MPEIKIMPIDIASENMNDKTGHHPKSLPFIMDALNFKM